MRLNMYAVYDSAAQLYQRPFCAGQDGEAMRAFSDLATNPDHPCGQHPEDYSLYRIGTYDDAKAIMKDEENECLMTGITAKKGDA